jgi:hypothetical protein
MAIRQTEAWAGKKKTIIVGVDKDMLQVQGWHLNPNKGFKQISQREGEWRLYIQAAMGDPTDNIGGCYKCGIKKAEAHILSAMLEVEKWRAVVNLYQQSIDQYGDMYNGLTAEEAATENMRLVYLLRAQDEHWEKPGV